jgi:hypothetical protein
MTWQDWANCCHVLQGSIITPLILQGKPIITDMYISQHFNNQKKCHEFNKREQSEFDGKPIKNTIRGEGTQNYFSQCTSIGWNL